MSVPRRPRIELAGGIHHVTNRGNRKERIFLDARDRMFFLRELTTTRKRYGWNCLAHCLMDNHFHLVIETPEETLGVGMKRLEGRYAQWFNHRHERIGHLVQERFGSVLVRTDEQFAQLLRYVALNPVAAALCGDPADWRWSSHRELLSGPRWGPRGRVEALLERWGGEFGTRYRHLFGPGHVLQVRFGADSPWTHRPALEELLAGEDLEDAMRAARGHGYTLTEVAQAVGFSVATVWRRTAREK